MEPRIEPSLELVSAFLDGEDVPAEALAASLTLPEARAFLRDTLALRAGLHDEARPSPRFYGGIEKAARRGAERWWRRRVAVPAAALAAATLLAVVLLGAWAVRDRSQAPGVPEVARVVPFEPGVDWHSLGEGP